MSMIMSIIMGIVLTTILGASIGPNVVEQMKIKKVENKTIGNQVAIKGAIDRYIVMTGKYPKNFDDLKSQGLLKDYHKDNLFSGGYSFLINEEKGTLTIYTQFDDDNAGKYFKNSLKTSNTPICVELVGEACKDNLYETFYLLPLISMEKGNGVGSNEVGSNEYIKKVFTKEKLGDKEYYVKNPPKDGDKDYVYVVGDKVEEFVYNEMINKWISNGEKVVGGLGKSSGVEIKNVGVPNARIEGGYRIVEDVPYEKVICNTNSIGKEVFVINENKKLGEIVYVPNNHLDLSSRLSSGYSANNICISNFTDMNGDLDIFMDVNFNQPLNRWDTSNVENMSKMFYDLSSFNQPLNAWDVSNVETMQSMFEIASSSMGPMFGPVSSFNQPLNAWDVSNVKNMERMFREAESFNQPLNAWDVSNVKTMQSMFEYASSFNQPLNDWNVSSVQNMQSMFEYARSFNQPLNNWNVSSVQNMAKMFYGIYSFNQPLNNWNTSNVQDMKGMFAFTNSFNQPLNNWNTSNVQNMANMFYGTGNFNQNINSWNVSNVENMANMFGSNYSFNQPLNNWNTSNVQDMEGMFYAAGNFNQNISNWNVSKVTKRAAFDHGANKWISGYKPIFK